MGKVTGFMEYARELPPRRSVTERINDWFEIYRAFPEENIRQQGARCMDCGVPFCHNGCPVNNIIPDWNEFHVHMAEDKLRQQGARCMDCGIPFCHTGSLLNGMASGCPIHNLIQMERPGLSRSLEGGAGTAAQNQQLP